MSTKLINDNKKEYGDLYQQHLFDQYKLYIDSADKISERRQTANNYFITINTLLISFVGIVSNNTKFATNNNWVVVVGITGLLICFFWYILISSYKQLNSGKFHLIHEIEDKLPLNIYKHEWSVLKEGKDRKTYYPFSHVEIHIPKVFGLIYILFLVFSFC